MLVTKTVNGMAYATTEYYLDNKVMLEVIVPKAIEIASIIDKKVTITYQIEE